MVARAENGYVEVVPYDECIGYLASETVGRLAWVSRGTPFVVPVTHGTARRW